MGDTRLEPLVLSQAERRTLENWAKRRKTAQGLALRARIVLACADGGPNIAVAARLGVLAYYHPATVLPTPELGRRFRPRLPSPASPSSDRLTRSHIVVRPARPTVATQRVLAPLGRRPGP